MSVTTEAMLLLLCALAVLIKTASLYYSKKLQFRLIAFHFVLLSVIVLGMYILFSFIGNVEWLQTLLFKLDVQLSCRTLVQYISRYLGFDLGMMGQCMVIVILGLGNELSLHMMSPGPSSPVSEASSGDWRKYLKSPSPSGSEATLPSEPNAVQPGSIPETYPSPTMDGYQPSEADWAMLRKTLDSPSPPSSPTSSWVEGAVTDYGFGDQGEGSSSAQKPSLPEVGRGFILDQINARLLLAAGNKSGWQPPMEKIDTLISLKEQVILRMAELDPHPFWMGEQNRNRLIADSILTKNNWEYNPETLSKRLSQLNERGINCSFYHDLKKLREDGGP